MEAKLYSKNSDGSVDCFLCRHRCHIGRGRLGICAVRENTDGTLETIYYGKPTAMAVDPIEKKPLYHFLPGSKSFSVATLGCNFQCPFCQNWDISQVADIRHRRSDIRHQTADSVANKAHETGCKTVAYTYSEPTVFFEYSYDIAKAAEKYDIKNVYVTNGFMTREMLDEFGPLLHAANIDLKAFNPKTYKTMMKGDLGGVLDSIRYMKELGIWIEITTLLVTEMNDGKDEVSQIAEFIADVGKEIPWHISRFHPAYKITDRHATSIETLEMAYAAGKDAGLRYIYVGNVPAGDKENTYCYNCGEELITRCGFSVESNKIGTGSKCPKCSSKIDGFFQQP